MKYEIYIKGKAEDNTASCGVVVLKDGKQIVSNGKFFEDYILTKYWRYKILPNRGHFQMVLYALAWGLTFCEDNNEVSVYSNSLAVVSWINKWEVPEEYEPIFDYCRHSWRGDEKVYLEAELKLILSSKRNMQLFLDGTEIRYRNHVKNKKGKLESVECYFVECRHVITEVK